MTAATDKDHYATYKIVFNSPKATLNNGKPITLTDTMNNSLSIDHSSVQVTTDPADAEVSYTFNGEIINGESTGGTVGTYVIPDGIESIAGGAFDDCTDLTSLTIPCSVTSIGENAFSGCRGLASVMWNALRLF